MVDQPKVRYVVTRIVGSHEGDLAAALNALDSKSSFELHNAANGDVLLIEDRGEPAATADEPAQPVAS